MWTPRRVLLLLAGAAVFVAGYLGYARLMGGIDGLPQLPAAYLPRPRDSERVLPPLPPRTTVDEMLQQAFGPGCEELSRPIRVGSSARGVYMAAEVFRFEDDGKKVRLEPVSLAMYGKSVGGRYPEINTLRAKVAYLTLDRPINGPNDIGNRKIVAGELNGEIKIVHNRRTAAQDDDIDIYIPTGPVYFDDAQRLIQSNDVLELKDMQSKPEPMRVTAMGMEVHLAPAAAPSGSKPPARGKEMAKDRPAGPSEHREGGVERIVLRSNVNMHLYPEPGTGFPTPGRGSTAATVQKPPESAAPAGTGRTAPATAAGTNLAAPEAAKPAGPPAKDHIHISTSGPFLYDLTTNRARFDIPDNPNRRFPEQVVMIRNPELPSKDQLRCEHLELQFRRKNEGTEPAKPAADEGGYGLQIETARATGKEVVLTSDAEFLEAHGSELFHDARTKQTTLRGDPEMWLLKEGNEIHAREMEMVDQKGVQQITGRGAGRIHLLDKKTGKRNFHARWKEKFQSGKDGSFDLLTLVGDAAFVDDEALNPADVLLDEQLLGTKTLLKGDLLQVWLEGKSGGVVGAKEVTPAGDEGAGSRRPHQVEATGHVVARAPDMFIHDTERLVILFKDVPAAPVPPGAAVAPGKPAPAPSGIGSFLPGMARPEPKPASPVAGGVGTPAKPGAAGLAAPEAPAKPSRPIDLSARMVKAYVSRAGAKTELDELRTEGAVRVLQAPASPEDKGVDIRGETLRLTHRADGNLLVVTGDLAQLRMDKLFIIGPEINVDQAANTAWVNGIGAMQMETTTDFQGGKLARPVPLEVHWNKRMDFDGDSVEFHGGIQAEQGTSRLACESLQVYLDRPVSLKEGNKGGQPARARKLTCDRSVRVEEKVYAVPGGPLASYRRLDCVELTVNNDDSYVHGKGPGWVRLVQPGGGELGAGGLSPTPAAPGTPAPASPRPVRPDPARPVGPDDEWKLTLINYYERMSADNKNRTANFWDEVKVLHVPWDRDKPDGPVDLDRLIDKLPPGGIYLRCDRLTVYSRLEQERRGQQMDALGRVEVKATDAKGQTFWGNADEVHFDEEKDQVIFVGREGGRARLYLVEAPGTPPKVVTGNKIIYLRRKGEFTGDGLTEIRGSN